MCGAVGLFCLCPGTGIDPHADGRGLRIGRVLGCDLASSIDVSIAPRKRVTDPIAHGKAVLEGRCLDLDGGRDGCREATLHGKREASPASQALGKVQS